MTNFHIAEYDEVSAKLEEIREAANFIPDASNKDGYDKSKRVSLDVGKVLTTLEKKRKEKKAFYLEGGREVDSQAKTIKAALEEIQLPHKEAYKAIDIAKKEAEEKRKKEITDRIEAMENMPEMLEDSSSSEVHEALGYIQDDQCLDYYEFTERALKAKNKACDQLSLMFTQKMKAEAEAAELEKLRKESAEREQKEREERIKREASEKAEAEKNAAIERERAAKEAELKAREDAIKAEEQAKEAEARRIEQQKIADQQRIEAEKQAKINAEIAAKEAAERARIQEQERQAAEQKRIDDELAAREADKKHIGSIRKAAKEALMLEGLTEDQAKRVVLAICKKKITNVTIKY